MIARSEEERVMFDRMDKGNAQLWPGTLMRAEGAPVAEAEHAERRAAQAATAKPAKQDGSSSRPAREAEKARERL